MRHPYVFVSTMSSICICNTNGRLTSICLCNTNEWLTTDAVSHPLTQWVMTHGATAHDSVSLTHWVIRCSTMSHPYECLVTALCSLTQVYTHVSVRGVRDTIYTYLSPHDNVLSWIDIVAPYLCVTRHCSAMMRPPLSHTCLHSRKCVWCSWPNIYIFVTNSKCVCGDAVHV